MSPRHFIYGLVAFGLLNVSLKAQDESAAGLAIFEKTGFSPGETPTAPAVELEEIESQGRGMIQTQELERSWESLQKWRDSLNDKTGLRIAAFYTMLYQQGTNGPGRLSAAAGDLDLLTQWTFLGRGTKNTGQVFFDTEYRHAIGPLPASGLGRELGTLQRTTHAFNDRGLVIRDFNYIQKLFDGRLILLIGRAAPRDMGGGHALQSANTFFLNRNFSDANTVPFPGFGFTAGLTLRPVDAFYLSAGASNAYGNTITNDIPLLNQADFFSFAETGWTPNLSGLGAGRYRFYLWHLDDRNLIGAPGDWGFSGIIDQELGNFWQTFARYGWSENGASGIKSSAQFGFAYRDFGNRRGNLVGLAYGASEGANGGNPEQVLETFVRVQVTSFLQATVGVQGIFDPVNSDDAAVAVFSARLRTAF